MAFFRNPPSLPPTLPVLLIAPLLPFLLLNILLSKTTIASFNMIPPSQPSPNTLRCASFSWGWSWGHTYGLGDSSLTDVICGRQGKQDVPDRRMRSRRSFRRYSLRPALHLHCPPEKKLWFDNTCLCAHHDRSPLCGSSSLLHAHPHAESSLPPARTKPGCKCE